MDKIRVLIVDDHPLMRDALCAAIGDEPDMEVAGQARDGIEAVAQAHALSPDVIVMDLLLPGKSGIEATVEICAAAGSAAHILALTSSADESKFMEAVQAGALSFLQKDTERAELLRAIRAVAQGHPYLPPALVRKLLDHARQPAPSDQPAASSLTAREQEIVRLISQGASNGEIARELNLSEGTVRAHVHHVLTKLRLKNRHQLTLYAVRH